MIEFSKIMGYEGKLLYLGLDVDYENYDLEKIFYTVAVYTDVPKSIPLEIAKCPTEADAYKAFREFNEKYRMKRNFKNKNGQTVGALRKIGVKARVIKRSETGLERGIEVYYCLPNGSIRRKEFDPNQLFGDPIDIAKLIKKHLMGAYDAKF